VPDDPQKAPRRGAKPAHHERDRYDWITLGTAIVGVAVVAASTVFIAFQAFVTRDQLRNAVSQQRAWLKMESAPAGPLLIREDGAHVTIVITATNVGSEPAVKVRGSAHLYLTPPPSQLKGKYPFGQPLTCDPIDDAEANYGVTIFPGESAKLALVVPFLERRYFDSYSDEAGRVGLFVSTCVDYVTGTHRIWHHTGASYIVVGGDGVTPFRTSTKIGATHQNQINLFRLGAGDAAN
jgi:hypothetical protein